jgi:hypothetical protein
VNEPQEVLRQFQALFLGEGILRSTLHSLKSCSRRVGSKKALLMVAFA